jgi:hypothetical protein
MGRLEEIVLDLKVLNQELHRSIAVCLDPPDLRCRENNYGWFFRLKERRDCGFIIKAKGTLGHQQIGETFCFEPSNKRAAYHSAMAGNEDFIRLLQLHCSL